MEFWKNRWGYWVYRFQRGGPGSRRQRSTGEKNRAEAWKIAVKAEREAKIRTRGESPVCSVHELVEIWLRENPCPQKSESYRRSMETLGRMHLYGLADLSVDRATEQAVRTARTAYIEDGHGLASANHWLRLMKALFRFAWKEMKMLDRMPWTLARLKPQDPVRAILPPRKTQAWFAAVDACGRPEVSLAVRLMWGLGLRESEALNARWEWLDLESGVYTPGQAKNRHAEPIRIRGALRAYLAPLVKTKGWMISKPDGTLWKPGLCRTIMRKANLACGTEGITPHRLRGTFATLLMQLLPPKETQDQMRHAHVTTTLIYTAKDYTLVDRALETMDRAAGF